MNQYCILNDLPKFVVSSPDTGEIFELEPKSESFTNYSFASNFMKPFYYSTGRFGDKINQGAKKPTLNLEDERINGFDSSKSFIKRFLRRRLGERINPDSEIFEFINHLYREVSFSRSTSPSAMTDGGEQDEPGLAVIQINVGPADDLSTVMQMSEGSILHL